MRVVAQERAAAEEGSGHGCAPQPQLRNIWMDNSFL